MASVADIAGIPVDFDADRQYFVFGEEVVCQDCEHVSLGDLSPALLNKSLRYPEYVYTRHHRVVTTDHQESSDWHKQLKYDVYVLPNGLLGIEYIKTHIFWTEESAKPVACIVEVLYGTLTIVMQKNKPKEEYEFDVQVEEARIVEVSAGQRTTIPTGYLYTFINSTGEPVVFSVLTANEHVIDYSRMVREQGLAYFFIAKNAKTEMVSNPRYRIVPECINDDPENLLQRCEKLKFADALYNLAVKKTKELLEILY